MPANDHELVNFSEDYELNRHLRKAGFGQTQENRDTLKGLGDATKKAKGKSRLTHADLELAIDKSKPKFKK
ncbi:hypothetical protein [Vibrio splendidus]|uniref:hypothetical protein n=1 Tax=Vibrio splendidus TaxID=29497 RepID=UPI001E4C8B26|nr:hypothetical protein [Vibrio splendidus]MCC4862180.1 hypothetical protein [Vibrio splendidus]CAK2254479.1 conserved hypothetical protein [Vibrio crassostreae]